MSLSRIMVGRSDRNRPGPGLKLQIKDLNDIKTHLEYCALCALLFDTKPNRIQVGTKIDTRLK